MIVICDQIIEQSRSVLTPLYDAAWGLIKHIERKGIDGYDYGNTIYLLHTQVADSPLEFGKDSFWILFETLPNILFKYG